MTPIVIQIKSEFSKIGYLNFLIALIGTVILAVHFNGHIKSQISLITDVHYYSIITLSVSSGIIMGIGLTIT